MADETHGGLESFMGLHPYIKEFQMLGAEIVALQPFFLDLDGGPVEASPSAVDLRYPESEPEGLAFKLESEWFEVLEGIQQGRYSGEQLARFEELAQHTCALIENFRSELLEEGREIIADSTALREARRRLIERRRKTSKPN